MRSCSNSSPKLRPPAASLSSVGVPPALAGFLVAEIRPSCYSVPRIESIDAFFSLHSLSFEGS